MILAYWGCDSRLVFQTIFLSGEKKKEEETKRNPNKPQNPTKTTKTLTQKPADKDYSNSLVS